MIVVCPNELSWNRDWAIFLKFKSSKPHFDSKVNRKHVKKKKKSDVFEDFGANNPQSIVILTILHSSHASCLFFSSCLICHISDLRDGSKISFLTV